MCPVILAKENEKKVVFISTKIKDWFVMGIRQSYVLDWVQVRIGMCCLNDCDLLYKHQQGHKCVFDLQKSRVGHMSVELAGTTVCITLSLTFTCYHSLPIIPLPSLPRRSAVCPVELLLVCECWVCVHHGEPPSCCGGQLLSPCVQRGFLYEVAEQPCSQIDMHSLFQDPSSSRSMCQSR